MKREEKSGVFRLVNITSLPCNDRYPVIQSQLPVRKQCIHRRKKVSDCLRQAVMDAEVHSAVVDESVRSR